MIWYIILFAIIIGLIYWKVLKPRWYWSKQGVRQIPFLESCRDIFKRASFADVVLGFYNKYPNDRYMGVYQFQRPILLLKDPDLIRQIAVKDFDNFTDHLSFIGDEEQEPLFSRNLFLLQGQKWKNMRSTLSPAFTGSKMKGMYSMMTDCSKQFIKHFEETENHDVIDVDLKDIFTRYANDVIGTCAFGIQCDSLAQKDNTFYTMGKQATNLTGIWSTIKFTIMFSMPSVSKLLGIKIFSKTVTDFFTNLVRDTVKFREEQNMYRPDMIHLLMEARKGKLKYEESKDAIKDTGFATVEESTIGIPKEANTEEISLLDMTAQAVLFFFGGFDSVSNLMCFMGYELGLNPDIQQRLYEEITETLQDYNGNISYEVLSKMKYLDMVVAESLRKWPMAPAVDRVCTNEYTIKPETVSEVPIHLKKGSVLWIPIWGLHFDSKYFPNPNRFDPERFSDENKSNIKPYTYMPFGVGPRNCIASRFALLEVKALYVHLLSRFEIVPTSKTQIPITLKKLPFAIVPEKGFLLGLKGRNNKIG